MRAADRNTLTSHNLAQRDEPEPFRRDPRREWHRSLATPNGAKASIDDAKKSRRSENDTAFGPQSLSGPRKRLHSIRADPVRSARPRSAAAGRRIRRSGSAHPCCRAHACQALIPCWAEYGSDPMDVSAIVDSLPTMTVLVARWYPSSWSPTGHGAGHAERDHRACPRSEVRPAAGITSHNASNCSGERRP